MKQQEMSKKQYVVLPAYSGNSELLLYVDGKLKSQEIIADYALDAHTSILENMRYTRAYYIPACERRLEKAYAAYREAMEELERARPYALKLSEDEARRFELIIGE